MQIGQPSRTAQGAAAHRAVHQIVEGGVIFSDPFAVAILGDDSRAGLSEMADDPSHRPMRLFIAARSRFSEDTLAACVARGIRQVVVLGAGLDTFSLRNPHASQGVRVFEVDYPATQGWKRERLRQAGLYLTREAVAETFDFIAGVPESEVVFDYAEPFENYSADRRANVMAVAESAALRGEPWLSLFEPNEVSEMVRNSGFGVVEDIGLAELTDRFYGTLKEGTRIGPGAHVVRARKIG